MDIEAPAAASVDEEFIWLLPFTQDHTNAWMTAYSKNKDSKGDTVVEATIQFKFHFRYQSVKAGSSFTEVELAAPKVFIECQNRALYNFSHTKGNPHLRN
jgi:hypothetical protein